MKSNLCDIEVIYQTETERAYCIREDERSESTWLPKSECEIDGALERGMVVTLTAPEWLLTEKGLI